MGRWGLVEPGCGSEWPGGGSAGAAWDHVSPGSFSDGMMTARDGHGPGLWPCGTGWAGGRVPADRAKAEEAREAAGEDQGGARAPSDLLCDYWGLCSAAPRLAPPARLGSPGGTRT